MAFNSKNLLALAALLSTLWAVVATSKSRDSFESATLFISSDCVLPVREGSVTTANNQVIGGSASSFTDFGFPQAIVVANAEVSGIIGAVQRVCYPTYTDTQERKYIYSCYDNGSASCSILMQQN